MDVELKTYLLTPSAVTDEDHVCQNCRGAPGGQNRDIHLTFSGPRLQRATGATSRLPSLAPLRCARQLSHFLSNLPHLCILSVGLSLRENFTALCTGLNFTSLSKQA